MNIQDLSVHRIRSATTNSLGLGYIRLSFDHVVRSFANCLIRSWSVGRTSHSRFPAATSLNPISVSENRKVFFTITISTRKSSWHYSLK